MYIFVHVCTIVSYFPGTSMLSTDAGRRQALMIPPDLISGFGAEGPCIGGDALPPRTSSKHQK